MEIWEPKPPGTVWATPGLLRDSFTFTFTFNRTKDVNVPEVLCSVNIVILLCNILMNISLAEMLDTERKQEKIKLN